MVKYLAVVAVLLATVGQARAQGCNGGGGYYQYGGYPQYAPQGYGYAPQYGSYGYPSPPQVYTYSNFGNCPNGQCFAQQGYGYGQPYYQQYAPPPYFRDPRFADGLQVRFDRPRFCVGPYCR